MSKKINSSCSSSNLSNSEDGCGSAEKNKSKEALKPQSPDQELEESLQSEKNSPEDL